MPGTTRYSATFDRTYEEEDRVDPPPPTNSRRSRSASWQANTCLDGRPYTPLGGRPPAPRSSSTDNGPGKGPEFIPTRTAKTTVKAHNNPFQFVAVGTCPLYKKAEEQLKKVKEVKKVDVLKEEEEDWQSNLDSWKSRRRKMSEDVFKRQEEIKQLEIEEQIAQISQTKQKTKTFSEMVESRATRGRALSLCLLNSPLEFKNWEFEDKTYKNGSCSLTDESGENSTVNSEDEGVSIRRRLGRGYQSENDINHRTNGDAHFEQSSTKSSFLKENTAEDNLQIKAKENSYIDSGLESISSSHRAGDTPDSGSDFSQDSNSSIDCDSPRTGVNVLEEFSSKASQISKGHEVSVTLCFESKEKDFGFTILDSKDEGHVVIASVLEGSKAALSDIHLGDRIINIDGNDVSSKEHSDIAAILQKCRENGQVHLLLWRPSESAKSTNDLHKKENNNKPSTDSQNAKYEKSVESENEMFVDDYEDLQRQSELLACSKTSEMTNSKLQAQAERCKTSSNNDTKNISSENVTVTNLKENIINGAVKEAIKNEQKADSGTNNESPKKNIVKVKKVRRKGVYTLNPNETSQDNTSVSSLFPLSPVTELPSPADETKTIISALSSVNSTVIGSSVGKNVDENKANNTVAKSSSSVTKENKTASSTKKSDAAKAVNSTVNQECSQNNMNKCIEKNTEKSNVPTSPSATKDEDMNISPLASQNDKLKSSPTSKKVKVKVKKDTPSEQIPTDTPQIIYESSTASTSGSAVVGVSKGIQPNNEENSACQPQEKPKKSKLNIETSVSAAKKETSKTSITNTPNSVVQRIAKELEAKKKEEKQISIAKEKPLKTATVKDTTVSSVTKMSEVAPSDGITTVVVAETTSVVNDIPNATEKADKARDTILNTKKNESTNSLSKSQTVKGKKPKSPQSEKPKPFNPENLDFKENASKQDSVNSVYGNKRISSSSVPTTSQNSTPKTTKENQIEKEEESTAVPKLKQGNVNSKSDTISPVTREKGGLSAEIVTVTSNTNHVSIKDKAPVVSTAADKKRNLSLDIGVKNNAPNSSTVQGTKAKSPKTPQSEKSKPVFPLKKENAKLKEKNNLSNSTTAVNVGNDKKVSQVSPSPTDSPSKTIVNLSTIKNNKKSDLDVVAFAITPEKNEVPISTVNLQEEKSKLMPPKRSRNKSKKKNINSQNINVPAKQGEELKNSNDSLNIVFQSQESNLCLKNESVNLESSENNAIEKSISTDLVPDVPPVEKIAEEMEKLILEQLEEEERAKELSSGLNVNLLGSPEHLLTAPPKKAEPPKEKPPPPPSSNEGNQKEPSLKRVNSTKRIKKEIHKRRSNFLGIDSADENIACNEPSIPPPPALEEILKAEMELDRQSRLKIENASTERLILEERKIMQKEREIIESLESEERQKQAKIDSKNEINAGSDASSEEIRIESLKNERKRLETQRQLSEEQQQIHLLEEKQLREREEFIRQQEATNSAGTLSDSISVSADASNTPRLELSSSLSSETKSNLLLLGANGGGKSISNASAEVSENKPSEKDEKTKKPAVPPKPLKKKEAIRKERERLRQEQEALQREREEHRLKLLLEQEEMMKKSHAPDAPVSRLGLLPPIVPSSYPPQLTTTMNPALNSREKASFPSRSYHGAINGAVGNVNAVDIMSPPAVRHNKLSTSNKAVVNEAWGQQKMPSVRKQNHDPLTESRYNQNHWLIQEAEMRRIAELKERQRTAQLSCSQTHLAEDDVCSNTPRVPVIPPVHNPHLNYAVQDKMWNNTPSSMPLKKYPPPVIKEVPINTKSARDTVSQKPPTKPSRVVPMERQEQMLSVSGRKRCSHCNEELGRGAAMIIESLQLYYHIHCFQCCVCQAQLGNGSCGTDVRVRNNKLHCHNCYSNDEAGLKFSQV